MEGNICSNFLCLHCISFPFNTRRELISYRKLLQSSTKYVATISREGSYSASKETIFTTWMVRRMGRPIFEATELQIVIYEIESCVPFFVRVRYPHPCHSRFHPSDLMIFDSIHAVFSRRIFQRTETETDRFFSCSWHLCFSPPELARDRTGKWCFCPDIIDVTQSRYYQYLSVVICCALLSISLWRLIEIWFPLLPAAHNVFPYVFGSGLNRASWMGFVW